MDRLDGLIATALDQRLPPSPALVRIKRRAVAEACAQGWRDPAVAGHRVLELAAAHPAVWAELRQRAVTVVALRLLIELGAPYDPVTDCWTIPSDFGGRLDAAIQRRYVSV